MKRSSILTGGIMLLYAAFWRWYTGSQTPLTAGEVEHHIQKLTAMNRVDSNSEVIARIRAFLLADTGRSFVMVNLIRLYDQPQPVNGTPMPDETSAATLQRYTSVFLPALLKKAGHPVLAGKMAAEAVEAWGLPNAEQWTTVGLVRYRSRHDMIEAVTNPAFTGIHPFKVSAIEKTIAVPVDPWLYAGDPRLLTGLLAVIAILLTRILARPS